MVIKESVCLHRGEAGCGAVGPAHQTEFGNSGVAMTEETVHLVKFMFMFAKGCLTDGAQ